MDKNQLRKTYLALRRGKTQAELKRLSEKIQAHLKNWDVYQNASTVMTYLSMADEVDTFALVKDMLKMGKRVCVPVCDIQKHTMTAHRIKDLNALTESAYGVMEPIEECPVGIEEIDLILVPGCVFGKNMHRIGYGKGYYDRFLAQKPQKTVAAGLCFGFCVVEEVPAQSFDEKLDTIITENGAAV